MPWRETIIRVHSQQFACEGGQIFGARCGVHELRVVEKKSLGIQGMMMMKVDRLRINYSEATTTPMW